jgi:uroporphyrinogen-III synthase
MVTRPLAQCAALCDALRAEGAEPLVFPLINIVPLEDFRELDAALGKLRADDWIFLTSQNAVAPLAARLEALGFAAAVAKDLRIAAIGPASQNSAADFGLKINYVAKVHDGVSLAHELGEQLRDRQVLLPRSDIAGSELPDAIAQHGGTALETIAYRTEQDRNCKAEIAALLDAGKIDAIACFSPSAVRSLREIIGSERFLSTQDRIVLAAVGPITAGAFRQNGVAEPIVAEDTTDAAVVKVLRDLFASPVSKRISSHDPANINSPQSHLAGAKQP